MEKNWLDPLVELADVYGVPWHLRSIQQHVLVVEQVSARAADEIARLRADLLSAHGQLTEMELAVVKLLAAWDGKSEERFLVAIDRLRKFLPSQKKSKNNS